VVASNILSEERSLGRSLLIHFSHISSTETNGVRLWRTGCRIWHLFRSSPSLFPKFPVL